MSKSYGNTLTLSETRARDPRQAQRPWSPTPPASAATDPGNPEVCPVGDLHKVFSTPDVQQQVWTGCTTAGIGCIECKGWLADSVVRAIAPIQQRRAELATQPNLITDILRDGATRAQTRANQTIAEVHHVMGLD